MKTDKKTQGKKNLEAGRRFENKVRKALESKGWIVSRWCNNIELPYDIPVPKNPKTKCECIPKRFMGKLIPAKQGPFRKVSTGFPDFIGIKVLDFKIEKSKELGEMDKMVFEAIGIEVKSNGYLTKEEKAKCAWLIKNNIFSKILLASKGKKRGEIKYTEV